MCSPGCDVYSCCIQYVTQNYSSVSFFVSRDRSRALFFSRQSRLTSEHATARASTCQILCVLHALMLVHRRYKYAGFSSAISFMFHTSRVLTVKRNIMRGGGYPIRRRARSASTSVILRFQLIFDIFFCFVSPGVSYAQRAPTECESTLLDGVA